MKNIFAYESKITQTLMIIGDHIILNLLFLICCIPVVTIGAAQSGLYNGVRVLVNKNDDSSCIKAFFRGFTNGFWKITWIWCVILALTGLILWNLMQVLAYGAAGANAPVVISVISLCFILVFQTQLIHFHSQFDCRPWHLSKNTLLLIFAKPVGSILSAILVWLPVAIFLIDSFFFMKITPVWLTAYYTLAFSINHFLMRKTFRVLIEDFEAAKGSK